MCVRGGLSEDHAPMHPLDMEDVRVLEVRTPLVDKHGKYGLAKEIPTPQRPLGIEKRSLRIVVLHHSLKLSSLRAACTPLHHCPNLTNPATAKGFRYSHESIGCCALLGEEQTEHRSQNGRTTRSVFGG